MKSLQCFPLTLNYQRARSLQRESVRWFTSSRNYRFLTAIGAAAFVVLGAAICQIKASDYSALFIHRSGANFIWSIVTLLFCTVEFCRMYRKKEGLWSWEVGSAVWLGVTVVVTGLAIANNIAGTMDLAPKIYTALQTTPYPFYYGQTTVRFPITTTMDEFALFPKSKNSQILNEWNTWQWSVWRKAIFILYCFCTVVEGLVMIFCYLPYIFFKVHEFRLGYGRRLLSSKQVHDVTVNAVRAYNAAVYNRKKLKQALEHGNTPQPVDVEPVSEEVSSEKAETEVSTISQSNRFKRACDLVRPGKQAILPLFVDENESGYYPSESYSRPYGSSYGSYYTTSYYTNYTKPTTTETIRSNKRKRSATPKSDSYYTYYDGYSSYSSNSSKSRRTSSRKTSTTAYSDSYSDYSGPTVVTRHPGGRSRDDTSSYTYYTSYYEDEDADTFTEYIPAASFRRSPTQYTYASPYTTNRSDNYDSYNQLDDRSRRYYTTATYTGSATGTSSGTTTQSSSYSSSSASSTQTATTTSDGYSTVENSITEVGTTESSHSRRIHHPHRR